MMNLPNWKNFWLTYSMGTAVLFVYYYRHLVTTGELAFDFYLMFIALYLTLLLLIRTKWELAAYIFLTVLITALGIFLHVNGMSKSEGLIWPLYGLLANMPSKFERWSKVLVAYTGSVIFFLAYEYPFPITTAIALIGLYMGIRSRRIRRDAYNMSKLHLQELDKAYSDLKHVHDELQEANIYSMRYAALAERTRIAREIHDGLGHNLTSLIIQLQALEVMLVQSQEEKAVNKVKEVVNIAREGIKEVRRAVKEWTEEDGMLGLVALKGLISQTEAHSQLKCELIQNGQVSEWSVQTSVVLYRILQESLTNVLRHAKATSVIVQVREEDDRVIMIISDDGFYTKDHSVTPGFGINGMIERCSTVGGQFTFSTHHPHGLTIEAVIPL
jgi:signal transduction histidine kinase